MICTRCGHLADDDARTCSECGQQLRTHDLPLDLSGTGVEHSDPRLLRALGIFLTVGLLAAVAVWFASRGIINSFDKGVQDLAAAQSATPSAADPQLRQAAKPSPTPTVNPTEQPRAAALPSTAKQCSPTVGASSTTSCGLAKAVASQLPKEPSGRFTVRATSPSSGNTYDLQCQANRMVVCTGGSNVSVYVLY